MQLWINPQNCSKTTFNLNRIPIWLKHHWIQTTLCTCISLETHHVLLILHQEVVKHCNFWRRYLNGNVFPTDGNVLLKLQLLVEIWYFAKITQKWLQGIKLRTIIVLHCLSFSLSCSLYYSFISHFLKIFFLSISLYGLFHTQGSIHLPLSLSPSFLSQACTYCTCTHLPSALQCESSRNAQVVTCSSRERWRC